MEKEKRYSYIRKKLARGTVGACILSGLALLLFLFCLAYSFFKKGEAGPESYGKTIDFVRLVKMHFAIMRRLWERDWSFHGRE